MSIEIAVGLATVSILLFDIFQSVLVPRYTPASLRIAPLLVSRIGWPLFKSISRFIRNEVTLDIFLGAFAPVAFILVFVLWLTALTCSFGLIIYGLGNEFRPAINDLGTACYVAGTAILTIGFGDIVSTGAPGRFLLLAGATTGITIVAIAVSFLFSMQQSVHARETMVHSYQARIGRHASGLHLLLRYAELGIKDQLAGQIHEWETWMSQVLTSHRSFPLLCYFRSGHMSIPWITLIGVMLDAANLLSTTVSEKRFGHADFLLKLGSKAVNIFASYFKLHPAKRELSRAEFQQAYELLKEHGYELYEEERAWRKFQLTRMQYSPALNALAFNFVCPTPGFLEESDLHPVQNTLDESATADSLSYVLGGK